MNRRRCITGGFLALMLPLGLATSGWSSSANASEIRSEGMAVIPTGMFRPLFRGEKDPREIRVPAFQLDRHPVKNAEFLEFVRANPRWQRGSVKRLFADDAYLRHWGSDVTFADGAGQQPVTNVSWFAAKAFASWKGKRLPTTTEWERAAGAGYESGEGTKEPKFVAEVSRWYSTPAPPTLPLVGQSRPNFFGVHDLHGLVWEWTSDFNSAIVTGDAREDTGIERQLFCGAGSLGTNDRANFPAFMRYGFRSSLKASYTIHNLGFRCARDL